MKINQNLLADIFQDGMVLPRNKNFKIGGQVSPNETVKVVFKDHEYNVDADSTGEWELILPAVSDMKKYDLIVATTNKKQKITNIQFGRVYLLSGQSNIEYRLKDEEHFENVKADLDQNKYLNLYYYNVPQVNYIDPESGEIKPKDLKNENWHHVDSENCGEMSAVGYYMIEQLSHRGVTEPIAIVDCFKGGTSASVWIKKEDLANDAELKKKFLDEYHKEIDGKTWQDFDRQTEQYNQLVDKHNHDLNGYLKEHPDVSLSSAKNIVGHTPWPPPARPDLYTRPSGLFGTMMKQVIHCTFSGMVWYQGENDTDRAEQYSKLLPLLINTWRRELHDSSLPVKLIQLPGYADYPGNSGALIRQIQLEISKDMPQVDLVSFVDGGEEHNIHPTNKKLVGERLGNIWFGNDYAGTPFIDSTSVREGKLILTVARSQVLRLMSHSKIEVGFADGDVQTIQLTDQNLSNNQIVLPLDQTQKIRSVSYGYTNYPSHVGIYNEYNYPLSPFLINF